MSQFMSRTLRFAGALAVVCLIAGCDTAPMRIPGASFSFPEVGKIEKASRVSDDSVFVDEVQDIRSQHYGEDIAKTGWKACADDTLAKGSAPTLIKSRLVDALSQAAVFRSISATQSSAKWVVQTKVRAFCSQTRGFIYRRVAGIVAIDFKLLREGKVAWEGTVERVVTDADPEYSGSFITTVEQGMRRTMADALRVVLQSAVRQIEAAVGTAS